ncbi:hypothetical protein [Peptostreptococcus faecalis]|uniref:hypothetical protein n=1 Tax=Peptostreptococcus faecalis TaxID=2045015 RepID=UPI000C7CDB43|nr:hypothetical protein [Peptostreptococcus faecalis]
MNIKEFKRKIRIYHPFIIGSLLFMVLAYFREDEFRNIETFERIVLIIAYIFGLWTLNKNEDRLKCNSDKPRVARLKRNDYLKEYYKRFYWIRLFFVSSIVAILISFISIKYTSTYYYVGLLYGYAATIPLVLDSIKIYDICEKE